MNWLLQFHSRRFDDLAVLGEFPFYERLKFFGGTAGNLNAEVEEEEGGPFVPSTDGEEMASGTDESNPKGSKREPFPKTSASSDDDE